MIDVDVVVSVVIACALDIVGGLDLLHISSISTLLYISNYVENDDNNGDDNGDDYDGGENNNDSDVEVCWGSDGVRLGPHLAGCTVPGRTVTSGCPWRTWRASGCTPSLDMCLRVKERRIRLLHGSSVCVDVHSDQEENAECGIRQGTYILR